MQVIDPHKDYYAILDILPEADDQDIKQAYRELARRFHPDSVQGDADRFRLVKEAYEVLQDPILRRAYDRQREARGLSESSLLEVEVVLSRSQVPLLDTKQMVYGMVSLRPRAEGAVTLKKRLNLALVIDRSTSMRGVRMRNVKIAAMDLLEALHPEDRLALVTFSDRAEVAASSHLLKEMRLFSSAITAMEPGGGTEIYQGLLAGLQEVRRYASESYTNHVILLTDGRTYGDEELTLQEARQANSEGISISAMGIGEDWNDTFLDSLAQYGGGVAQYISSPSQLQQLLHGQIQDLNSIVVRDLRLKLNLVSSVTLHGAYRAAPYMEALRNIRDNTITLGKLSADEPLIIVVELQIERQEPGERRLGRFEVKAEELSTSRQVSLWRDVKITFSLNPIQESVPPRLLNYLSRLSVFRLQENAWKALEVGNAQEATRYLQAAATRLFEMEYKELAQAAMVEVDRISKGVTPTEQGRKKLRYGTRSLPIPSD